MPQSSGTMSLMTGFNRVIDIYMTMNALVGVELAYGITQLPWASQRTILNNCLECVNQVTGPVATRALARLGYRVEPGCLPR